MTRGFGLAVGAMAALWLATACAPSEPSAEYIRITADRYAELIADAENVDVRQQGEWTLVHTLGDLQADLAEHPGELELNTYRIVTGWYTIRTDQIPSTQPQPKEGS